MSEMRMDDARLAAALSDLGAHIAYPEFPSLRGRALDAIARPPRRTLWERTASPRYGIAPALVTAALILLAVLASLPGTRAAAKEILRLRGIEIFRGPVPTGTTSLAASATPRSPGAALDLGERVSLEEARQRAGFPVVVPTDPLLGAPDEVYVMTRGTATQVSFVYFTRRGIATSPRAHVAALVSEIGHATLEAAFLGKIVGPDTRIEPVTVNGGSGYWLEGAPHGIFYRAVGAANVVDERLRLASNTLVWEQGDVLMRIEAQVDRATALAIAASVR